MEENEFCSIGQDIFDTESEYERIKQEKEKRMKEKGITKVKKTKEEDREDFINKRRIKTREKYKQKRRDAALHNKEVTMNMTKEEKQKYYDDLKAKKQEIKQGVKDAYNSNFQIIFDLDYTEHMKQEDIKSLAVQMGYSYGLNKKIKTKIAFYYTNFNGPLKDQVERMGGLLWHVHRTEEMFYNDKEILGLNKEFIYLSPDAEKDLEEVTEDKIYIIGGLVDKPVIKNRSLLRVKSILDDNPNLKLSCFKLPLAKYVDNLYNPALNVNTVVQILSNYLDYKDWKKAIDIALPNRMLWKEKNKNN